MLRLRISLTKGIANPLVFAPARCRNDADHIGRNALAQLMRTAIDQTPNEDKVRTADLGGMGILRSLARLSSAGCLRWVFPSGFIDNSYCLFLGCEK